MSTSSPRVRQLVPGELVGKLRQRSAVGAPVEAKCESHLWGVAVDALAASALANAATRSSRSRRMYSWTARLTGHGAYSLTEETGVEQTAPFVVVGATLSPLPTPSSAEDLQETGDKVQGGGWGLLLRSSGGDGGASPILRRILWWRSIGLSSAAPGSAPFRGDLFAHPRGRLSRRLSRGPSGPLGPNSFARQLSSLAKPIDNQRCEAQLPHKHARARRDIDGLRRRRMRGRRRRRPARAVARLRQEEGWTAYSFEGLGRVDVTQFTAVCFDVCLYGCTVVHQQIAGVGLPLVRSEV